MGKNVYLAALCLHTCYVFFFCREQCDIKNYIRQLQEKYGVTVAVRDEDWDTLSRTPVTIRRDKLVEDALRECEKTRFDPTKLLKV